MNTEILNKTEIDTEKEITDPIETFAEQLEKIDIATYLCHNCALEEMQKIKKRVIRDKKKEDRKKELEKLQEVSEVTEVTEETN